jgi:D-alanyl-D-alanine carboxypeptidase/D-alanyl-D-alanine-endopeptidase (penicillin-binding protein 4)
VKNNKIISQALLIFFILLIFISISFGVPLSSRTPLSRDGESSDYLDRIEVIDPSKVYQTPIEYPTVQQPSFENTMDSILNLLNSFEGFVGMELRNLSSNQVLLSFNEDKLFTPASLSKIITALISLESLGTNYRFETQVFRSSPITSNYNGNIYIKGFGNPVLSSDEYKYILKKSYRRSRNYKIIWKYCI